MSPRSPASKPGGRPAPNGGGAAVTEPADFLRTSASLRRTRRGRVRDIMSVARHHGLDEFPLSTAAEPSFDEKGLIDHHRDRYLALGNLSTSNVEEFEQRFSASEEMPRKEHLDALESQAQAEIADLRTNARPELIAGEDRLQGLKIEMQEFRKDNHLLSRDADAPDSQLHHYAIIVAIIVAESVLNASFFAAASNQGLLGGWMQALFVSLTNVGLAVFVGNFVLREFWHVKPWRRVLGGFGMLAFFGFVVLFNLVAAHYRDLMELHDPLAAIHALPAALASPFGLTFNSIMLFVLGLVAAGLGLWKGLTSDDHYPGYGRVTERLAKAQAARDRSRLDLWNRIKDRLCALDRSFGAIGTEGAERLESLRAVEGDAEKWEQSHVSSLETIQKDMERDVGAYREQNHRIRITRCPDYFRHFETFPDTLDRETLHSFKSRREEAAAKLALLMREIEARALLGARRLEKAQKDHGGFLDDIGKEVSASRAAQIAAGSPQAQPAAGAN